MARRRHEVAMKSAGWLGLGVVVLLAGCRPDAAVRQGSPEGGEVKAPAAAAVDPATLGEVVGTVNFAGKAPAPVRIDTSMDPACGLGGGEAYSEQYAVKDGRLGNVFVYVKSGPAAAMVTPAETGAAVVLDQKGCVYLPHVIGVMAGGYVEFRNEDPTMHNVHAMPTAIGNETVDLSEGPRGTPQVKRFRAPEAMIPVRCNNHPWMNAFINVSATPWFAVTGPDGTFDLKGLPAGDYTLAAVQEKLGERTIAITVKPRAKTTGDFGFAMPPATK
jgi:plastocyanin